MKRQGHAPRPMQSRRAGTLLMIGALMFVLTACEFGQAAPTPEPFNAPTYQPGFQQPAPQSDTDRENGTTTDTDSGTGSDTGSESESSATGQAAATSSTTGQAESQTSVALAARTGQSAAGSYAGEIVADEQVSIVSEVAGMALIVPIEVGQSVVAGDVLVRIDNSTLEAQRAQALAGLEAAQAQRELLNESANDSEIEAARAAVAAADAAYKRALEGPTAEDITVAEAQLRQAQAAVSRAQAAYDQVAWSPLIGALPESLQLEQATLSLEAAQAQYDKLLLGATADVIAGAYAQLAQARAQLERIEEGPAQAQIQAAEAQVRQAEAALYLAQLQLDKATVRAPMTGVILRVQAAPGNMLASGAPVATIMSHAVNV
ncbi:MAG: biotin/lipoyl-binding protein, partial [Litorilinea sp.]